jgi:hypothetical protein
MVPSLLVLLLIVALGAAGSRLGTLGLPPWLAATMSLVAALALPFSLFLGFLSALGDPVPMSRRQAEWTIAFWCVAGSIVAFSFLVELMASAAWPASRPGRAWRLAVARALVVVRLLVMATPFALVLLDTTAVGSDPMSLGVLLPAAMVAAPLLLCGCALWVWGSARRQ